MKKSHKLICEIFSLLILRNNNYNYINFLKEGIMGFILLSIMLIVIIRLIGMNKIILLIKEVNNYYVNSKIIIQIILFISEVSVILAIYDVTIQRSKLSSLIIFVMIILIFHYIIGYIVSKLLRYYESLSKSLDNDIKGEFLLSYFFISIDIFVIILLPSIAIKNIYAIIITDIISYLGNMYVLFKIIYNPEVIRLSRENSNFFSYLMAGLINIFLIIINLYILIVGVYVIEPNSFSNNPNLLDLFYYTITSFTTIGFGDIIPLTVLGKIVLIIISFTSILCISVFIGSIYNNRK